MERFLSRCAAYISNKHAGHLHELCIVFPNRRAGVFFNSYLQKQLVSPVIGPYVTTINEFIAGHSNLQQGEKLQLISELYGIYKKHIHTGESFDEFYFWGEVLLADFNDIDRYLVDAKDLFSNVADLKEIDQLFDYLTPEQKEALARFWGSMPASGKKAHHEKFISIWQKLYPIYADFKLLLKEKNTAYGGMVSRMVAGIFKENMPEVEFRKIYFVGLNALNSCEKLIFEALREKAEFLWDYDGFYLEDTQNEAGKFLRENLKQFPPPEDFILNTSSFSEKKNIKLVAVPSVYGQAQQIPHFLEENSSAVKNEFDNCAVVLADESLLFPALGAIPVSYDTINVTMGYPVKNSVVYGFFLLLLNLIKNHRRNKEGRVVAYHRFVTDILNHQLMAGIAGEQNRMFLGNMKKFNRVTVPLDEISFSSFHRLVFSIPEKVDDYSRYFLEVLAELYTITKAEETENQLLSELIHSLYQAVERIDKMINDVQKEQGREISEPVFIRLFSQYAGQQSVAFEGEPVHGMQVMGILETRCIDFENLIILGFNENKWPRKFTAPSFIPYNIRKGFGLPGIDEQDAMYAYYFYRLIQRAKNITATYCTIKEGISTGELSRYGYQLLYSANFDITKSTLDFGFSNDSSFPIIIKGSRAKRNVLLERNSPNTPLSPTAINMWLQCRLRFYFRYILQLAEPDEMKDEIDSPVFGSIFHETIEHLYKPLLGKVVNKSDLDAVKNNRVKMENEITKAIGKHYFKQKAPGKITLEGKTILIFENIKTFLQRLIEIDMELVPFELISLEGKFASPVLITIDGKFQEIYIGGTIDRVDKTDGKYRVIDYKTGNVESFSLNEVEELFEKDKEKPKKEILQALIYCHVFQQNSGVKGDLQPAVYSLRRLFDEKFSGDLKLNRTPLVYQEVQHEFLDNIQKLVTEIFTSDVQYYQTSHEKYCQFCSYNKICQRY